MNSKELIKEISFKAIRSSGAGGQHINKVSSKIELTFDIESSLTLSKDEKILLLKNLTSRLTKNNVLILYCDKSRSQHKNKEIIIERFLEIIYNGLIIPKKRKQTQISKSVRKKRLEKKKKQAYKKALRKKPEVE